MPLRLWMHLLSFMQKHQFIGLIEQFWLSVGFEQVNRSEIEQISIIKRSDAIHSPKLDFMMPSLGLVGRFWL